MTSEIIKELTLIKDTSEVKSEKMGMKSEGP